MSETEQNVYLCDRCNAEQGGGIVDKGDTGCSACGQHTAPHVYVPVSEVERLTRELQTAREALREGDGKVVRLDTARAALNRAARLAALHPTEGRCPGCGAELGDEHDQDAHLETEWRMETGSRDPQGPPIGWRPKHPTEGQG